MTEIQISTPEELIQAFNSLPSHFIFRGQANADWELESALERIVGAGWCADEARKYEAFSLAKFKPKFHLYDRENIQPKSTLAWLALMQHYGVPTRLLDFTDSPFVALYFALESYRASSKADIAVFALDYRAVTAASVAELRRSDRTFAYSDDQIYDSQDDIFENYIDPRAYDIAWITEPHEHNQRLDRQGGCFLLSGNRNKRIRDVLEEDLYSGSEFVKYRIESALHRNMFALLRKMSLTGKVLYGDLHGLAVTVRMEMEAYSSM